MRHYEIVFLVDAEQTSQVAGMIENYRDIIKEDGGHMHRMEDWGVRQLAYPIKKLNNAHYVLMNIECSSEALGKIKYSFQFNDAVIRDLIIRRDEAITKESDIVRMAREEEEASKRASAA